MSHPYFGLSHNHMQERIVARCDRCEQMGTGPWFDRNEYASVHAAERAGQAPVGWEMADLGLPTLCPTCVKLRAGHDLDANDVLHIIEWAAREERLSPNLRQAPDPEPYRAIVIAALAATGEDAPDARTQA